MPTYEYVCDACGHAFDLFQQMSDPVKRKCPECAKSALRRLIGTGAGVLFKGGGFYETDYRSESYRKAEKAAQEPAPAPATSSDSAESGSSGTGKAVEAPAPAAKAAPEGASAKASPPVKSERSPAKGAKKLTKRTRR